MLIKHYLFFVALFSCFFGLAQRGNLGNQTISVQDTWVNTYTYLTGNASNGTTTLSVDDNAMTGAQFTGPLDQGDLILIIQMQGASVDINTTPTAVWGGNYTAQNSFLSTFTYEITEFGAVTNYNGAGHFEYAEVAGVSGGSTITLNCGLIHDYLTAGHVQIVRVPRYEDLTINNNASISGPQWNGLSGGVVAVEVNGDLTLTGTGNIDADGLGFRGGQADNISLNASGAGGGTGFLGSFEVSEGAEKGEGIFGTFTDVDGIFSRYCFGAIANGGGGANYHNAGGGGGSNVGNGTYYAYGVPAPGPSNSYAPAWNLENPSMLSTPSSGGGRGGYSHAEINNNPFSVGPDNNAWGSDYRRITGGAGGHPLNYDANRLFMGGGGGAGDDNDGYGGDGGNGGGIVMVQVYGAISGTGSISANGEDGGNAEGPAPTPFTTQKTGDDGAGGAGGGGSVFIQNATAIPSGISLSAIGGNGGDQFLQYSTFANEQADGPGGGGGGGLISYTSGSPAEDISGGLAGETNSSFVTSFPVNGATGGDDGIGGQTTSFYDLIAEDDMVCGGGSTTLTVTVNGTLPSGSSVQWYNAAFGGSSIQSGNSFTTPSLSSNTTYYVGVCPGTFRIPVEVVVSPAITISGSATTSPETCAGNDGSITGLSASGGFGTLTFDWNGTVTPTEDLNNAVGGSYTLTVTDANGCSETVGPFTITPSPGPSIDLTNISIQNETCLGNDGSITGIIATGSNISFEWNGNAASDEDISGLTAGTYTLTVTDDASCTTTAGPFTVGTDPGPSIDDSNILIEDETCFGADGEITGIVATGTNLTYEWNGDNTLSEDTIALDAGTYTLTVTDGVGCSATSGPYTVNEIPGPTVDDNNIQIDDEGCNQGNGSISGITASGNNLAFVWNGVNEPQIDINNLSAGTYTLEVIDDLGCSVTVGPYTINNIVGPSIDASNIMISGETCNGNDGSITGIQVNGAGNITYAWTPSGQTTLELIDVAQGNYALEVTDENGCTAQAGPFTINEIPVPTIDASNVVVSDASCDGGDGSIANIVTTGADLTFEWNGNVSPTADISDLTEGDYTLVITDTNNCSASFGPITVNGPEVATVTINTSDQVIDAGDAVLIDATVNPSSSTINWSPSAGLSCTDCEDPEATPASSSWYVVTVTSADGCTASDSIFIEVVDPCGEVMVPTIFSPNNDGLNDQLCVLGGCIQTMSLQIYNRWGELVFESNDPTDCWDGTFRDQKVNTGTFIYKLSVRRDDGTDFQSAGNVNVVR